MLGRITAWGPNNMVCAQVEKPSYLFIKAKTIADYLAPLGEKTTAMLLSHKEV